MTPGNKSTHTTASQLDLSKGHSNEMTQIERQLTLKKNLLAFQIFCPAIYERYLHFKPKTTHVTIDETGEPNLLRNNQYLLDDHSYTQSKIDGFIENPECIRFIVGDSSWSKTLFLHDFHLERIRHSFHQLPDESKLDYPEILPCLLFIGIGLGDQITRLNNEFYIKNIIIYEPDDEIFFAALSLFDFEPILRQYTEQNRSIQFYVGGSPKKSAEEIVSQIRKKGGYFYIEMFIFSHYTSDAFVDFYQTLQESYHRGFNGLGFVEDELIGFSHLMLKLKKGSQYLNNAKERTDVPVFIIGSGPSLDAEIEFVRNFQSQAVIISCSSSIEICFKNGIKPDFHVDIERTDKVMRYLERVPTVGFLDQIVLLGTSTIHPCVMGCFKEERFCLKNNDFATSLFKAVFNDTLEELDSTHPTSGNGAVSFANRLGFKNIVLFGIDLGMKNSDQHHSSQSLYFDKEGYLYTPEVKGQVTLQGNFSGKVISTFLLETARHTLKTLFQINPEIKCFNTSDGAFIPGATPLKADQLHTQIAFQNIDKSAVVDAVLKATTQELDYQSFPRELEHNWMKLYLLVENTIAVFLSFFNEPLHTKKELLERLDQQNERARKAFASNTCLQVLLGGAFAQLQSSIAVVMLRIKDGDGFHTALRPIIIMCHEHLMDSKELYRNCIGLTIEKYDFEAYKKKYPQAYELQKAAEQQSEH